MSNFKFNTTADIINHFRTIIRTDIDPNCSKSLSDFKFTDLENPDLRVLTGGSYYTSTNLTNTNSATTVSVPSSYLISNVLNTQFNGPIDWPVGAFPIRDGAASNWYAAKANNYTSMSTSANMEITMTWDSAYTLTAYSGSTLLFTCKDCPQIMLDLQAPGGAGADGYGWRSSVYNYRGYSGGGGGGSVMGEGGIGQRCSTNTYYVATSGGIGAGGGGGCTHVSSNGYNTKAAAGGTGKIIFYFPGP